MRGAGKTTIGKKLAKKLGCEFVEMDALVEQKAGMPIADIVAKHGWGYFRDLESEVVKEVAKLENVIVATGGGVVQRPENIANLKKKGKIVLLTASADTLVLRIGTNTKRPMLTKAATMRKDVETVLQRRNRLYRKAADFVIDTESKPILAIVKEVLQKYDNE